MVFGAMTPFCSCSTIPILAGLLNSKVPFGPAMSFLISSPLMNPLMIFMLWALLGWKVAIVYFIVLAIFSILTGFVFSKMNLAETYKGVNVKGDGFFANKTESRFKQALNDAWAFYIQCFLTYLLVYLLERSYMDLYPKHLLLNMRVEVALYPYLLLLL